MPSSIKPYKIKALSKTEKAIFPLITKKLPAKNCKAVIGTSAINPIRQANNSFTIVTPETKILNRIKTVTNGIKQRIIAA